MRAINEPVVNGLPDYTSELYLTGLPKRADPACLSEAKAALWTNRVPDKEPWPRVLMGDTPSANGPNDEYTKNVHHEPQYNNVGESGRKDIGIVEGDETIPRGELWRR